MTREIMFANTVTKSVPVNALDPGLAIAHNAGTLGMAPIVSENVPSPNLVIMENASHAMRTVSRVVLVLSTN